MSYSPLIHTASGIISEKIKSPSTIDVWVTTTRSTCYCTPALYVLDKNYSQTISEDISNHLDYYLNYALVFRMT